MADKENQLLQIRKDQKEGSQGRIQRDSKNRFKKIIKRKITTCFIFALSEFENVFGQELWGHGLQEKELNSIQKANKRKWDQIRTNILNKGNAQIRALEAEMDLHTMEFQGYWMSFGGNKKDVNK
jgi:hypothetical protein